jgi:N-acetylmuramic acid 6-phosphate etherase
MAGPRTEEASERYRGIDTWSSEEVLSAIASAQRDAIEAVAAVVPALAAAGEAVAERLLRGGRFAYAGAGSSGLMAQVDAVELPGTYGIPAERVPVLLAGGPDALVVIPNGAEDDEASAESAVDALGLGPDDALIAIAASGRTPFPLAALRRARLRGALTLGMASNAGTPLLNEADHALLLATPPEVIAGSTRMNAGTAQKCALNMLSTLVGIRLGHVYDGLMVNVAADNAKLRQRALGIVARASGAERDAAASLLERASGNIKAAILLGKGAASLSEAEELLESRGGNVRAALGALAAQHRKTG